MALAVGICHQCALCDSDAIPVCPPITPRTHPPPESNQGSWEEASSFTASVVCLNKLLFPRVLLS